MKKAILVMAALVAFSFPTVSNAFDSATQFKDYVGNGTQPASKKGMLKAKMANGSIVDVARKANLAKAAIALGTTVLYYYYEDELDKSLYELFMQGQEIPEGTGTGDAQNSWTAGYVFIASSGTGPVFSTVQEAHDHYFPGSLYKQAVFHNGSWRTMDQFKQVTYLGYLKRSCSAWGYTDSACTASPPSSMDDGIATFQLDGSAYPKQPENEPNIIDFPDGRWMEVETAPDQVRQRVKVEILPNGNTRVTTQTEYLDENGNTRTKTDVVETNADGEVVSESSSDTEGGLDSAAAEEAAKGPQDVNVLNEDLAKDQSLQDIKDLLNSEQAPDAPNHQGVLDKYTEIENSISLLDAPLIDLPDFPVAFGGAAACKGITIDISHNGSYVNFHLYKVVDQHCQIAEDIINPILKYLFALLAAWYCWTCFKEETMRGI